MARQTLTFICQNCGAVYSRWQGKCDSCGEWNTIAEENAAAARPQGPGRAARKGRLFALEPLTGEAHDAPRLPSGLPELDRVTGGGFVRGSVLLVGGDPGIGKSTLLIQVAAALARAGHARGLHFRRGSGGAGAPARRAAGPRRRAGRARRRDLGRGHHRHALRGKDAAPRRDRFDPDHVDRPGRIGARHRDPGARLGAGADPLRQALGRRHHPRRPRHQGRPDRRSARGRAHGRRSALLRGRRGTVPHPARGQEPVRPDRRDRRVRNDRPRPARGRQPVGTVPFRPRPRRSRHGGIRRHRGHAAAAR